MVTFNIISTWYEKRNEYQNETADTIIYLNYLFNEVIDAPIVQWRAWIYITRLNEVTDRPEPLIKKKYPTKSLEHVMVDVCNR